MPSINMHVAMNELICCGHHKIVFCNKSNHLQQIDANVFNYYPCSGDYKTFFCINQIDCNQLTQMRSINIYVAMNELVLQNVCTKI